MEEFTMGCNEFIYTFNRRVKQKTTTICKIPAPTGRAKTVKNISWSLGYKMEAYGTIAVNPLSTQAVWEHLAPGCTVSPAITAIKIVNTNNASGSIFVTVLME